MTRGALNKTCVHDWELIEHHKISESLEQGEFFTNVSGTFYCRKCLKIRIISQKVKENEK